MKNQPLHGGKAQYFKALDATKATGCGFQTMVTNHCGDARGRKGVHICWEAHSLAFIQDGNQKKKKKAEFNRHRLPDACGTEKKKDICCSADPSSAQLNDLDLREAASLTSRGTNLERTEEAAS